LEHIGEGKIFVKSLYLGHLDKVNGEEEGLHSRWIPLWEQTKEGKNDEAQWKGSPVRSCFVA
jgi:hypothetical protein